MLLLLLLLLTLDHWTKIDSTAAAAAQLLLTSALHTLYRCFSFRLVIRQSFFVCCYLFLLSFHQDNPTEETFFQPHINTDTHTHSGTLCSSFADCFDCCCCCCTRIRVSSVHTPFGTCALLLLLPPHFTSSRTTFSSGHSTSRLAPAAARRRPDRCPFRMFHKTFPPRTHNNHHHRSSSTGEIDFWPGTLFRHSVSRSTVCSSPDEVSSPPLHHFSGSAC